MRYYDQARHVPQDALKAGHLNIYNEYSVTTPGNRMFCIKGK